MASFIEYAAKECVTLSEWHRFGHANYKDKDMEDARIDCISIFNEKLGEFDYGVEGQYRIRRRLTKNQQNALFALAKELRKKT